MADEEKAPEGVTTESTVEDKVENVSGDAGEIQAEEPKSEEEAEPVCEAEEPKSEEEAEIQIPSAEAA